jgi:AmiR/NasT family two-component response regulator
MITPLNAIAIADDDDAVHALLTRIFPGLGYRCLGAAKNGLEALAIAKEKKPQLMVVDIHMPVMDGLAATREIAKLGTTAVVIMTGDMSPDISQSAADAGASAFMRKPFDLYQVSAVLESAWRQFLSTQNLQKENRTLQESLETRKLVEKAEGILMQQGLSEPAAHQALQKMSQDQGLALKDVCQSLIHVRMILGGNPKSAPHKRSAS